jgi:hypothetical protein
VVDHVPFSLVIANETKQSIAPHVEAWITSPLSLLAMTAVRCLSFTHAGAPDFTSL